MTRRDKKIIMTKMHFLSPSRFKVFPYFYYSFRGISYGDTMNAVFFLFVKLKFLLLLLSSYGNFQSSWCYSDVYGG